MRVAGQPVSRPRLRRRRLVAGRPGALRRLHETGAHHESRYHLTFLCLPPPDHAGRAERWLYERQEGGGPDTDAWGQLEWFATETDRALELLSAILPEAEALTDAETLAYLHGTISDKPHPVAVPAIPSHLDAILTDTAFLAASSPSSARST
jgi:type IV secretion system protein TrbE